MQVRNCSVVCKIINQSLVSGEVPDLTKCAKVIPVFKEGARGLTTNYRPISVLPVLSKIMEKIVNVRLTKYLEEIKFLSDNQYGFRKSSDTSSAAVDLVSKIQNRVDKGDICGLVALDLCKAFDTVNPKILFNKLESLGIRGVCLKWFENYFYNRKQSVTANGVSSSQKNSSLRRAERVDSRANPFSNLY